MTGRSILSLCLLRFSLRTLSVFSEASNKWLSGDHGGWSQLRESAQECPVFKRRVFSKLIGEFKDKKFDFLKFRIKNIVEKNS